jgi:hypothetical protein
MGRTRDVSKILTSNTSILTLASASSVYQTIEKTGLIELTPSTISVTGGSGSVSATGAVSFTSASAISLNDVFSATYDNYRIYLSASSSTNANCTFRYRVSGADNSTANYDFQEMTRGGTTQGGGRSSGQTSMNWGGFGGSITTHIMDVTRPFAAENTSAIHFTNKYSNAAIEVMVTTSSFSTTTSFTGFSILPASGTITGSISVYGYNK